MSPSSPRFLPDRLRPHAPRRRGRWQLLALALLPALLAVGPAWRVRLVEVAACPALPTAARSCLAGLVGTPVCLLDLDWVRRSVERWPGVAAVEVRLDLAGTLHVAARPSRLDGSIPVGRRWHGVAPDGAITGSISDARAPVLEGFGHAPAQLLRGLEVARRLARETGGTVLRVCGVTPADCLVELELGRDARAVRVHVQPEATESERFWSRQVRAGAWVPDWADLREQRRLVVGGRNGSSGEAAESDTGAGGGPA